MLNSNKPIKVAHLQKLAHQSMLNSALVRKTLVVWESVERSNLKKLRHGRHCLKVEPGPRDSGPWDPGTTLKV